MAVEPVLCIDGVLQSFHNLYPGAWTGGEQVHTPTRTVNHHYG